MGVRAIKFLWFVGGVSFGVSLFADDLELRDLDVSGWPCLNQPSGTAKTPDGLERNKQKNRPLVPLPPNVELLDTAGFLKKVSAYDAELNVQKRTQLSAAQKAKLNEYENQIISLTGYLVLSYPGPGETCNCADKIFHDWHLEIFDKLSDHHPQIGDPTPIICEITPRTEQRIFQDGIRLQTLSGFFRSQKEYISTNHPPQRIKVTGYLMYDDEHSGKADIGTTVQYITSGNGFHHPWRSTAWEIHPVIKVEVLQSSTSTPSPTNPSLTSPQPATSKSTAAPAPTVQPTLAQPQATVTLSVPVTLHTSAGYVTLPAGTRLPVISGTATTVRIRYNEQQFDIPANVTGAAH